MRHLTGIVLVLLAASPVLAAPPIKNIVLQKDDFTKRARPEKLPPSEEYAKESCLCTSEVSYPKLAGNDAVTQRMNAQLKTFAQKYVVTEKTEAFCQSNRLDYKVTRQDANAVTVLFTQGEFCGAYPNEYHRALNFNAKTGEILSFSTLIDSKTIDALEKTCVKQYAASAQSPYSVAEALEDEMVMGMFSLEVLATGDDGKQAREDHERSAYFKDKGLYYFYDNKAWNHASGEFSCRIPQGALKPAYRALVEPKP